MVTEKELKKKIEDLENNKEELKKENLDKYIKKKLEDELKEKNMDLLFFVFPVGLISFISFLSIISVIGLFYEISENRIIIMALFLTFISIIVWYNIKKYKYDDFVKINDEIRKEYILDYCKHLEVIKIKTKRKLKKKQKELKNKKEAEKLLKIIN